MPPFYFMKNIIFLIVFFILLLGPFLVRANIVINEIMYNLEGSDSGREWIEILNISDTEIDLNGWKFNDGSNHGLNKPPINNGQGSLKILADEYAILTGNAATFLASHPGFSNTVIDTVMSLKNTSATLKIFDSESNEIDSVTYESVWGADGDENSLQREDSSSWGIGDPTPGAINVISGEEPEEEPQEPDEPEEEPEESEEPTLKPDSFESGSGTNQPPIADAGNNIIAFIGEEVTFDGSGSRDPDGNELAYEWNLGEGGVKEDIVVIHQYSFPGTYLVTLRVYDGIHYATDTITVEVYPKKITINEFLPSPVGKDAEEEWIELYNDSDQIINISGWQLDDEDGGSKPFTFPENTLIAPKSYLVFSRQATNIALNNDSDKVRLLLSTGVVFQEVSYEKAKEGLSSALTPQGFVWSTPTPGLPNIVIVPSTSSGLKQTPAYTGSLQSETTNQPSQDTTLTHSPENSAKGGWQTLSKTDSPKETQNNYYNLANLEESTSSNNKLVLIILTIAVVTFAATICVLKLKRK